MSHIPTDSQWNNLAARIQAVTPLVVTISSVSVSGSSVTGTPSETFANCLAAFNADREVIYKVTLSSSAASALGVTAGTYNLRTVANYNGNGLDATCSVYQSAGKILSMTHYGSVAYFSADAIPHYSNYDGSSF